MKLASFQYQGRGKVLLNSEYLLLLGAKGLALPTKLKQKMDVTIKRGDETKLYWKSYDFQGNLWFEAVFETWHLDLISEETEHSKNLQIILKKARSLNIHFLREAGETHVKTTLDFPIQWGLGSSSTLIYNVAQWAYVSPLQLHREVSLGSGYDIVSASSEGPVQFWLEKGVPHWERTIFTPNFRDKLYFLPLGKKQPTENSVRKFKENSVQARPYISKFNDLHKKMMTTKNFEEFCQLLKTHEHLLSEILEMDSLEKSFQKMKMSTTQRNVLNQITMKSLGAWGGDMALIASEVDTSTLNIFFHAMGIEDNLITFKELILERENPDLIDRESREHKQLIKGITWPQRI